MYALEIKDLEFGYNENLVIKGVSFNIEKGKFISIIGPNGSGKSTLLKTINHLYNPTKGSILVDGININDMKKRDLAKKIALVPQDTVVDYDFTVEEIVLMGRHPYKSRFQKEDEGDYKVINESLEMTNTLKLKKRLITEISGGERQRVIIAKALAQKPSIILLDEPTSHLDINHQMDILNLLKRLNKEHGTTIILVIHDINLAARYSDEIILIDKGKISDMGKPEDIITSDNIENIYNLKVAIEKNKYTDTTYITPIEIRKLENIESKINIHIISGGGSGQEVVNKLYMEGYTLSLGVLNVGDTDWSHGKSLMLQIVEEIPFTKIGEEAYLENIHQIKKSDIIVITNMPIGYGNMKNLQAAYEGLKIGKPVYYINGDKENIDYTNGEARDLINKMQSKGLVIVDSVEMLMKDINHLNNK
jgi:iron complex transport system ATP-binding protein